MLSVGTPAAAAAREEEEESAVRGEKRRVSQSNEKQRCQEMKKFTN